MSTVLEIKRAIQNLTLEQRGELIADLPSLFPELDGDAAWDRILRDPRPRPALKALLDEAEQTYRGTPEKCAEVSDTALQQAS